MPRVETYSRRAAGFLQRHKWSVPLSLASLVSLAYLSLEMREGDLAGVDSTVAAAVQAWRGRADELMLALTRTGGGLGMTIVSLATILALLASKRRRAAAFMAAAAFGTFLLSTGLKLLFHRSRPLDLDYLIQVPSSFSFPSGHALGSMGVMTSVVVVLHAVHAPRWLRLLALALVPAYVIGVALSRVYFGVHYPSDVLGGALAAGAWVSALTGWFYPHLFPGERTLEPAPEP